jgi:hypothetical protein
MFGGRKQLLGNLPGLPLLVDSTFHPPIGRASYQARHTPPLATWVEKMLAYVPSVRGFVIDTTKIQPNTFGRAVQLSKTILAVSIQTGNSLSRIQLSRPADSPRKRVLTFHPYQIISSFAAKSVNMSDSSDAVAPERRFHFTSRSRGS